MSEQELAIRDGFDRAALRSVGLATSSLSVRSGVTARHASRTWTPEAAIRILNIIVASVGVIATAPLSLVIAALIKLTSRGPVFYVQTRVGVDRRGSRRSGVANCRRQTDSGGRPFRIYKFRTMTTDSEVNGQQWATQNDPRVTRVGKVLRKYRLDELPQLLNVIRGEMNVVGPRPEQPKLFEELREKIDGYQGRQRTLPGITGWAQINLAYDTSLDDVQRKVQYDLEYISQRSLKKDLEIMAKTLPVMVFKKGSL